jgi:hypothetical protein
MHPYEFSISLRLTHPTEDLASIYAKINTEPGFIPRQIWKVGSQRRGQQGQELEGTYDKSYCYFDLLTSPQKSTVESLSEAIEKNLELLEPFRSVLREHVESGGDSEFFVGLYIDSNSGETFYPDLMQKMAEFKIKLSIDIYPDTGT